MAKEIERKYKVTNDGYKDGERKYYKQGYISTDPERTVRVRIAGDKGFITIKGKNEGIVRREYEYQIDKEEAQEILEYIVKTGIVEKWRYCKTVGGKKWEVDEFLGDNEGLVVAEIELEREDEEFEKPDWIGEEVSGDERYYNSSLSENPYKNWK